MFDRLRGYGRSIKTSFKQNRIVRAMTFLVPMTFNRENTGNIVRGNVWGAVSITFNVLVPGLLGKMISAYTGPVNLYGTNVVEPLIVAGAFVTAKFIGDISPVFRDLEFAPIASRVAATGVVRYMSNMMHRSLLYHQNRRAGEDTNLAVKPWVAIPNLTTQFFSKIVPSIAETVVAVAFVSVGYDYRYGIILGGTLTVFIGYNYATTKPLIEARDVGVKTSINAFSDGVETPQSRFATILMFGAEEETIKDIAEVIGKDTVASINLNKMTPKLAIGQVMILSAGFIAVVMLASDDTEKGTLDTNKLNTLIYYLGIFTAPLGAFGAALSQMFASSAELKLVIDELEKPGPNDHRSAEPLIVTRYTASIEFRNVSFEHESMPTESKDEKHEEIPRKRIVLDNISFYINPGEKVGLVGESGAGKSTLVNLLQGFYVPKSGEILINGQNIAERSLQSVHMAISTVPQYPDMFNKSIRANIAYGYKPTEQQIQAAVEDSQLQSVLDKLPHGIDSVVGEGGTHLSGGEKQRVAIARALVRDPKILILDEASSGLDAKNEHQVQRTLDTLTYNADKKHSEGITTLAIAHRLKTLVNCTQILVLDNANIVERAISQPGKTAHEQLLEQKGIYSDTWEIQQNNVPSVPCPDLSSLRRRSIFQSGAAESKSSVDEFRITIDVPNGSEEVCIDMDDEPLVSAKSRSGRG